MPSATKKGHSTFEVIEVLCAKGACLNQDELIANNNSLIRPSLLIIPNSCVVHLHVAGVKSPTFWDRAYGTCHWKCRICINERIEQRDKRWSLRLLISVHLGPLDLQNETPCLPELAAIVQQFTHFVLATTFCIAA